MKEVWRDIKGYPNYAFNPETLAVKSKKRRVWNGNGYFYKAEQILKPSLSESGYYRFNLVKDGTRHYFKRSRISWLAHYGELPPKNLQIDHIDNDRTNDHIDNLQLLTCRENIAKKYIDSGKTLPTGVTIVGDKFVSKIRVGDRLEHLGTFTEVADASLAYQERLREVSYGS